MFDFLALLVVLEGGMLDDYTRTWEQEFIQYDAYYTDMSFRVQAFDLFFVGGGNRVTFVDHAGLSFMPQTETYTVEAGIEFKGFEAGVKHVCAHPMAFHGPDGNEVAADDVNFSFNQMYVKFTAKLGGK